MMMDVIAFVSCSDPPCMSLEASIAASIIDDF